MLNTEQFSNLYAEKLTAKTGETVKKGVAREQVDTFLETIVDALKEHDGVDFYQYFGLEVKDTAERKGVNPQTKEEITIPAGRKVALKRNKLVKEATK